MSNVFTDQRLLSAQELSRLAAAVDGTYVFPSTAGGAVTANSGLTLNVAAITGSTVTINGSVISTAYAGGTVTHDAADVTNPRRDYIYYNSSGAVGIKKGAAAAKPVLPDLASTEIAVAEIYIAANDTTISGASEIIDRRQSSSVAVAIAGTSSTPTATTSTSAVDLVTIAGLSIPVTDWVKVMFNCRKTATNASAVYFGLKLNSTVVAEASSTTNVASFTTNNRAEDGLSVINIAPRSTNYLQGFISMFAARVSSTGATAGTPAINNLATTAAMPSATITSVAIRAINDTSNNNAEVTSVRILTGVA